MPGIQRSHLIWLAGVWGLFFGMLAWWLINFTLILLFFPAIWVVSMLTGLAFFRRDRPEEGNPPSVTFRRALVIGGGWLVVFFLAIVIVGRLFAGDEYEGYCFECMDVSYHAPAPGYLAGIAATLGYAGTTWTENLVGRAFRKQTAGDEEELPAGTLRDSCLHYTFSFNTFIFGVALVAVALSFVAGFWEPKNVAAERLLNALVEGRTDDARADVCNETLEQVDNLRSIFSRPPEEGDRFVCTVYTNDEVHCEIRDERGRKQRTLKVPMRGDQVCTVD
jgi:hypothetical protein